MDMDEKANIYKLISAIPDGFTLDLNEMIGAPVTVMIQKYKKQSGKNAGKEDNKITSVLPVKKAENVCDWSTGKHPILL